MPGKYRSGQITTYRNLPEKTKQQIAYTATHLGLTRGALIATAMETFMAKLAVEGRLPEALAKLVGLETARLGGEEPSAASSLAADAAGRNTPQSPAGSNTPVSAESDLDRYVKALAEAGPTEPTAEDLAFEARLAERRAARDVIMGRVPGGSRG